MSSSVDAGGAGSGTPEPVQTESVDDDDFESISPAVDEFDSLKKLLEGLGEVAGDNASYFGSRPIPNQSSDKLHSLSMNIVTSAESIGLLCTPLMERAAEFDFNSCVHANGFRSLLRMVDAVMHGLLVESKYLQTNRAKSFLFSSNANFDQLTALLQALKGLARLVLLAGELMNSLEGGDLFPKDEAVSQLLLSKSQAVPRECFYGQCLGIHYVPSIKPVVQSISVAMASFGEGFLRHSTPHGQSQGSFGSSMRVVVSSMWHGTGFVLNHTRRAAQIVALTQSRDIHFTKAFWSLAEVSALQHMAELVIPSMAVAQQITLPIDVMHLACRAARHGAGVCKGRSVDADTASSRRGGRDVTPPCEITEEDVSSMALADDDVSAANATGALSMAETVTSAIMQAMAGGSTTLGTQQETAAVAAAVAVTADMFDVIEIEDCPVHRGDGDDGGDGTDVDGTDVDETPPPSYSSVSTVTTSQTVIMAASVALAATQADSAVPSAAAAVDDGDIDDGDTEEAGQRQQDVMSSGACDSHSTTGSSSFYTATCSDPVVAGGSAQPGVGPARAPSTHGQASTSESTEGTESCCMVSIPPPLMHTSDPASVNIHLISSTLREGQRPRSSTLSFKRKKPEAMARGILIHCHGGGFVATTTKSHQSYLRQWSLDLNVPVVSIDYSLAPEHPFPRAVSDCLFAYAWIINNAKMLGTTAERIVISGDSAGGNLAVAVTLAAIELGIRKPDAVMAAYAPFCVELILSPSRLLSVFDPLLPQGVLLACLDAYAGNHTSSPPRRKEQQQSRCSEDAADSSSVSTSFNSTTSLLSRSIGWNAGGGLSMQWSRLKASLGSVTNAAAAASTSDSGVHPAPVAAAAAAAAADDTEGVDVDVSDSGPAPSHPDQSGPAPSHPDQSGPAPSHPDQSGPAPSHPDQSGPAPSHPDQSGPAPSHPDQSGPAPSHPDQSGPAPSHPDQSGPAPSRQSDPATTDSDPTLQASASDHLQSAATAVSTTDDATVPLSPSLSCDSADFIKVSFADANRSLEENIVQLNEMQERMFKERPSPFMSPLRASDELLQQLPHVDLVACALDPLLDDSIAFAKRLADVNVSSQLHVADLLPHGFLNMAFVSKEARRAYDLCTQCIRNGLVVPDSTTASTSESTHF